MNRNTPVELTNMCMIYDDQGNVLVEEKVGKGYIVFLYRTNTYSGTIQSSSEGNIFWMSLEELQAREPFWHMDKMIEIFCHKNYSELFLDGSHGNRVPILK